MAHRYKIPAWVTEINFIWLLPVVMPFLIYGYLRGFLAFAAIHIESGSEVHGLLAFLSLVAGLLVGALANLIWMERR